MPLSETGKKLVELLLQQRFIELSTSLAVKRQEAARLEAKNHNSAALPMRLLAVQTEGLSTAMKMLLDTYLEVFTQEGTEITDEDAESLKRQGAESIQGRAQGAASEFQRYAAATGTQAAAYDSTLSRAAAVAISDFARELEIFRLRQKLPRSTMGRRAWLQERSDQLDVLLPIASRKAFDKDLPEALAEATPSEPLSLIETDVDFFKKVNDDHGHSAGDAVLKVVAQRHQAIAAIKGKAYRYGGEEMVILLPNASETEAVATAERLLSVIEAEVIPEIQRSVTLSAGVAACLDPRGVLPKSFFDLADDALYRAKKNGRNRVVAQSVTRTPPSSRTEEAAPALAAGGPSDVPPHVFATIREKCERDWPDNFQMRLFCEKTQLAAYRQLQTKS
jgi:diguanylate cyclase (GGDEF)-like protein